MGEENTAYTLAPLTDSKRYEGGLIDLWNRITPINSTRIGDTTIVDGKKVMNENKTFNTKPIEEIAKQYATREYETDDENAPFFYELENIDTGVKKYGIAPKGLEHRYANQNMSQWKVNYNKRRSDAVELESMIHGNEEMLKQKEVDLGFIENTQLGKGASEIYTRGLFGEKQKTGLEQDDPVSKLVNTVAYSNLPDKRVSSDNSFVNKLFGETLSESINKKPSQAMLKDISIENYLSELEAIPKDIKNEAELYTDKDFINKSKNVLGAFGVNIEGKSDKEIADIILKEQSNYGFNMTDMIWKVNAFRDKDKQVVQDWLDLEKMKDKTDLSVRQVSDAAKALASDPLSYVALVTMGATIPAKLVGQSALKKALSTAVGRGAITAGLEGATYSTADNLLRQNMEIQAGNQKTYDEDKAWASTATGTAVGGVLGGALGKAFAGNEQQALAEELAKNVKTMPKDETKEVQEKSSIEKLTGIVREKPKQNEETKQEKRIAEVAKEVVKPKEETLDVGTIDDKKIQQKKETIKTKSGRIVESSERVQGKKAIEKIDFEVSSPIKGGEEIEGNTFVPTIKNPKRFKLGYDERGRIYTEDSNLKSFQGTSEQKASLQIAPKREITSVDDEIDMRMQFYDNNAKLRKVYGQEQAKLKEQNDIPKDIEILNRKRFMQTQLAEIRKDRDVSETFRREANDRLRDLSKQKIKITKPTQEVVAKAEEKFIKSNPVLRPVDIKSRDEKLRKEYKTFVSNRGDKEGFERKPTKSDIETKTNIIKKYEARKLDTVKKIKNITLSELSSGNKNFSVKNITPEIRKKYGKEMADIEDFQNAKEDLVMYNKGNLSIDELRFREKRRMDERFQREETKFKSEKERDDFIDSAVKELDDIGIYQDKRKVLQKVETKDYVSNKNTKSSDKKEDKEAKELVSAKIKKDFLVRNIEKYRKTGRIPIDKNGRDSISQSQIDDVKQGILSSDEIANKTSPESIDALRKDAIKEARAFAAKKVNTTLAKQMNIKGRFKLPEDITFKDTVMDASNSVAQITAVLLSSKNMARLSKLYGENKDIRTMIGMNLEEQGLKLPKTLGDNGEQMSWKDVVKPMFMTENYGQMEKGLTRNFAKTHKMSYDEANKYVNGYFKAVDNIAPEMKILTETIYDLIKSGKRTKIEYNLPDDFKVEFNLTKTVDGRIRIQGEDVNIKLETDDFDEFSRAMMPNLIHSFDGYIANQMNKKGFPSIHDAFVIPKGKEEEAKKAYTEIMQKLNESNALDDVMKQLGYKGEPLKDRFEKLESEMIAKSDFKLGLEHEAGKSEKSKLREFDVSTQGTKESVMRDYMASGNYRQVKTSNLIDSMVNEAGYNNEFLKTAKESDDVFERQMALAMQSSSYNKELSISVPDGVDKRVWDSTQRNIFNESRAKLEMNPMINPALQGDRIYFDEFNKPLNMNNKTVQDFIVEEMRILKKLNKTNLPDKRLQHKVETVRSKKGKDLLTKEEAILRADSDEAIRLANIPNGSQYKTLWNEQVNNIGKYKEFNELQTKRNVGRAEVDRDVEILYERIANIDKKKKDEIMKLVKSDYESIRGFTKEDGEKLWNSDEARSIYAVAGKEINRGALGIAKQSEHFGAHLPNAHLIATRYDLPKESEPIIDAMISIKAMNDNDAWEIASKLSNDEDAIFVLDTLSEKRRMSEQYLFFDSPEKITKGYMSEVYHGNKKINNDGKISYDADDVYEEGLLGSEREDNRVGKLFKIKIEFPNTPEGMRQELDWMAKHRLRKTNGEYRKVAGEEIRIAAGKVDTLEEIVSATVRSVGNKLKEREMVYKVLDDISKGDSLLYSKEQKDGFFELNNSQKERLSYMLGSEVNYVDADLVDRLIGRKETRLYSSKGVDKNQGLLIADRLLSNMGTLFKQNVVLKNPTSYLNSFLVNQWLGSSVGITPDKLYTYQMRAMKDLKEMRELLKSDALNRLSGRERDRFLTDKLLNNQLYKMEKAGLSTNRVEGVVGDEDLLSSMLKDYVPSPIFKLGQVINLNQKTKAGRFAMRMYSNIDTMGRYMLTQKFIDDGLDIKSAAHKANGLFGDMDTMVPVAIEMLDKYGFVPFLKWFSKTTPQLLRVVKDNPKKAIAIGVATYIIGQETDTNLHTINPVEAAFDFGMEATGVGTVESLQKRGLLDTISNRASSNVIPKYVKNIWTNPETLGLEKLRKRNLKKPKSEKSMDYRGATQTLVEDYL